MNYLEQELTKNFKEADFDESDKIKHELFNRYSNKLTLGKSNNIYGNKNKSLIDDIYDDESRISSHIDPIETVNLNNQVKDELLNTSVLNFDKDDLDNILN